MFAFTCWCAGLCPRTNRLEGKYLNVVCQCQCEQCLLPLSLFPRGSWLVPASPRGSPKSTSGSYPGFFQTTASVLGLRTCDTLCMIFRSSLCYLWSSSSLQHKPRGFSKPNVLRAYFPSQDSWLRDPSVGSDTSLPGEDFIFVIFLPFVGHLPKDVGPDCTASLPPILINLWFLLYVFSCGNSFLLVFTSFS